MYIFEADLFGVEMIRPRWTERNRVSEKRDQKWPIKMAFYESLTVNSNISSERDTFISLFFRSLVAGIG